MHLEHLQAVLKEFNPINASNKTTLIYYFRKGICLSIQAQLDYQEQELDMWKEVV